MATNLPSCFFIQFLEQLLKFLANFTLLKYVNSQRSYGFLITKELIFGFQILDLKDHFSASLKVYIIRADINKQVTQGETEIHQSRSAYLKQSKIATLVKSVQSALSDLKRPPERLQSQYNYRLFIT